MRILTTVKKVVDVELTIRVEDGAIVEEGLQYVINAWDENAVEASVQLKEKSGAETTLVSIGGGDSRRWGRTAHSQVGNAHESGGVSSAPISARRQTI